MPAFLSRLVSRLRPSSPSSRSGSGSASRGSTAGGDEDDGLGELALSSYATAPVSTLSFAMPGGEGRVRPILMTGRASVRPRRRSMSSTSFSESTSPGNGGGQAGLMSGRRAPPPSLATEGSLGMHMNMHRLSSVESWDAAASPTDNLVAVSPTSVESRARAPTLEVDAVTGQAARRGIPMMVATAPNNEWEEDAAADSTGSFRPASLSSQNFMSMREDGTDPFDRLIATQLQPQFCPDPIVARRLDRNALAESEIIIPRMADDVADVVGGPVRRSITEPIMMPQIPAAAATAATGGMSTALMTSIPGLRAVPNSNTPDRVALGATQPAPAPVPAQPAPVPRVTLSGRRADVPAAMTEILAGQLRVHLPIKYRWARTWRLAYALGQHGISQATLFEKVKHMGPLLLVVQDVEGRVFGGFMSHAPAPTIGYYGSGECFLWRLACNKHNLNHSVNAQLESGAVLRVFHWTGKNTYSIFTEPDTGIAMGGGEGKFGLWIDPELDRGHSARCITFSNDPLAIDDFELTKEGTHVDGEVFEEGEFFVDKIEFWAVT